MLRFVIPTIAEESDAPPVTPAKAGVQSLGCSLSKAKDHRSIDLLRRDKLPQRPLGPRKDTRSHYYPPFASRRMSSARQHPGREHASAT